MALQYLVVHESFLNYRKMDDEDEIDDPLKSFWMEGDSLGNNMKNIE